MAILNQLTYISLSGERAWADKHKVFNQKEKKISYRVLKVSCHYGKFAVIVTI